MIRGLFVKHLKDFDEDFREKMKNVSLFERLKANDLDIYMPNTSKLSGEEQ